MTSPIRARFPLDFQWQTQEPFLFCVHHLDRYPRGEPHFGPAANHLRGRNLGQDFEPRQGFRMYHGETVPGFPVHPHRGFETVTIVRQGYIDHADSLGAAGRYGGGDVQWMTAGRGVQHSEMFPLLRREAENPVELFQLWLNLPAARKMADPDFKMFWNEKIPVIRSPDGKTQITLIAGDWESAHAIAPPQASWAAEPGSQTLIALLRIEAGGQLTLPASTQDANRSLYFYSGDEIHLGEESARSRTGFFLDSQASLSIRAEAGFAELLLLQSAPIGEPIAQYGPFVMNTQDEIRQTMLDYRRTQFGGWPWERDDMIHGPEPRRFAKYPDGRVEEPGR